MRLHLVRHGHTDALGRTLTGRAPGVELNAHGHASAEAAARAMAGLRVDRVLTSPQPRTRQTAAHFAAVLGIAVETSGALDEVDFGAWAGQDFAALDGKPAWRRWNRLRSLAPSDGGETMLAVQARVTALVQQLHQAGPHGAFLLVSHADVLRALLAHLLGAPIDLMQRLDLSPAGRSIVTVTDDDIRIEAVNVTPAEP